MSAFGIGVNCDPTEDEPVKGRVYDIACDCWFTSTHKIMPRMFKVKGDDEQIQTVKDIQVIHSEKKNYAGIPSIEFQCQAIIGGLIRGFRLIYYLTECRWVMVL